NPYNIADACLFVDTPEGIKTGTEPQYSLTSSDRFFWKGVLYLNGNLSLWGGTSFPSVWMRNPDQFAAAQADSTLYQATHGALVTNCFLDGLLLITGAVARTGNATLYGS